MSYNKNKRFNYTRPKSQCNLKTRLNNGFYFFLKHLSGLESHILESDWLIPRAPTVLIFPSGPRVRTALSFPGLRLF